MKKGLLAVIAIAPFLASCAGDLSYDAGIGGHPLSDMVAGVWIDGNGCEHWIIDDGVEGYMSPRWNPDGTPRCASNNVPYSTRNFDRGAPSLPLR